MDNRNLILAIVLSVVIMLGFEFYFSQRRPPPPPPSTTEQAPPPTAQPGGVPAEIPTPPTPDRADIPAPPGAPTARPGMETDTPKVGARDAVIAKTPRVTIASDRLHGSIALIGGTIDDLTLADYRETLDPDSPEIVVLSPRGTPGAYFAEFGWVASGNTAVPGPDTEWRADRRTLAPGSPVTLTWDNGAGLRFSRTYALDDDYMFTITQRVENTGAESATLFPYGLIDRRGTPEVTGFFILHEGLLGVFDGTLLEVDYDELQETGSMQQTTTGGWIGITDKYWLAALVPDQKAAVQTRFVHRRQSTTDRYQVDYLGTGSTVVAPGQSAAVESHFFAGAKEVALLDQYANDFGVDRFDLAIDFGWFYFLTKPIFYVLIYINDYLGNFGVAILLLTVIIKLIFFPLANKSYVAMTKMRKLQPEMVKLRDRFGDDKVRLNQEMMALYKREKTNPASGCLPILIQIPVFFALYKVLFVTIEMRHAPFFGWVQDLSAPDPTSMWNLFGLIPWDPSTYIPDAFNVGIWPLIMGGSMFLQQKLNPQPPDPVQAKIFLFLPILFTFLLAQFPAGLVVYWAWNNLLSILQQKVIMMRMGVK